MSHKKATVDSSIDALCSLEDFIGKDEDNLDDEFHDYEQEIARASFGDMVNDYERNRLFYEAIKKSVQRLKEEKNASQVHALDIGCGTGLLSMMAVRAGADKVTACDAFKPIADCAQRIIQHNGMSDKISIVPKQSNYLTIDQNEAKPNLLVAELLDTELIGEACLHTYRDAVKRLTSEDALFVPSRARIYIQLVQSEQLFRFHQYRKRFDVDDDGSHINTPNAVSGCFGSHILHDIQMSRLKLDVDFEVLSQPQVVFEFEFNNLESLKLSDCKRLRIPLLKPFTEPILVFTWWDIDMDHEGEIVLSCAPYWARGLASEDEVAWRDHWMQTIYYLPAFAFAQPDLEGFNHEEINASQSFLLDAFHDAFSIWYDLPGDQKGTKPIDSDSDVWSCCCGLHSQFSRSRLCALNNQHWYSTYWKAFKRQLETSFAGQGSLNFVYFGDEGIIPLLLATHHNIGQIFVHCQDNKSREFFRKFIAENEHVCSKVTLITSADFVSFLSKKLPPRPLHGIISELYFKNFDCLFPSMEYFDLLRLHHNMLLKHSPSSKLLSLPKRVTLQCLLVEFKEFWRSFADVGRDVEGFDLSHYDELIQSARQQVDWRIEPQQVWEYSCKPLVKQPTELFAFSLDDPDSLRQPLTKSVSFDVSHLKDKFTALRWPEKVALVVWMEQTLDDAGEFTLSTGPESDCPWPLENELAWCRHAHQGVAFLGKHWPTRATADGFRLQITFTRFLDSKSLTYSI